MSELSRRRFLAHSGLAAAAGAALPLGRALASSPAALPAASPADPGAALQLAWARFGPAGPGPFDSTHRLFADGATEVVLWPGDLERLQALGVPFEVTSPDLAASDAALARANSGRPAGLARQPGERTGYRTLADYENDLKALAAAHPAVARTFTLPHVTFEDRRVLALEIARDVHGPVDGRPTLLVDGLHHAREWPAGEMAIMFAFDLLEGDAAGDSKARQIVDGARTIIVPVVNPDGFAHSRAAPAETPGGNEAIVLGGRGAYWRKNRRSFTDYYAAEGLASDGGHQRYPEAVRGTDAYGVDVNRNYAFTWGRPGSSANDVHSQSHRGDSPFSEPESRNIAWLATTRHITGAMSHHTYAGEIIWPWANEMGAAPDAALFQQLASAAAALNGYRARKYNTSEGTTPDHLYGSTSTLAYLFEHGTTSFHPPYASTIPAMYQANRGAFYLLARRLCLDTDTHAVVTGRVVDTAGRGVTATLTIRKRYQSLLWLFGNGNAPGGRTQHEEVFEAAITTAPDGTFTWHVNPSTRPHIQKAGETEAWELAVSTAEAGTVRRLTVARGERLDMGDIPIV